MKKINIENEFLEVTINEFGAELTSVFNKKNVKEMLYQIHPDYWQRQSPHLFPIVGRLKNNSYFFGGKQYEMQQHGFARNKSFVIINQTKQSVEFQITDTQESFSTYPFLFEFCVKYTLNGKELCISYCISNKDDKIMYYNIGAHPAFAIEGNISEYSIFLENVERLVCEKLENGLRTSEFYSLNLENNYLQLSENLFLNDAIIISNQINKKCILLKNEIPVFSFNYADFLFLGIWKQLNSPFICLEPWMGLADNKNTTGLLENKQHIQYLEPGDSAYFTYSINFF